MSLPSRERPGLKRGLKHQWQNRQPSVAPLAGAWIETRIRMTEEQKNQVAPLAGAWIEN